ncbi:class I SAM-dependent methyltransferase [Sphingomicrobium sediminis]|uniref:Methyltransferase domain-containing protein n=1 Tax=Sphingomicrobium sediminis TaxID=2950949 RepID=A0A9X2J2V0_9SPHN|nr:methyltransferase domain-containing protein [Sphingomicrobium sediminis]MCM8556661.1 methyltransferase domain-containing protein [Sphingomicrobium sediminis]
MLPSSAVHWDMVASGYAMSTMDFLEKYSISALDMTEVGAGDTLADIACGPGALALHAASRGASVTAVDFSVNMLSQLQQQVTERNIRNLHTFLENGENLSLASDSFDFAFSMFGLNFYQKRKRGFRELHRIVKPGGTACVGVFASPEQSPLIEHLFGIVEEIAPSPPSPANDIDSLEHPNILRREMVVAGFSDVHIQPVVHETEFKSAQDFVARMAKGSAPLLMLRGRMSDAEWNEALDRASTRLEEKAGPFPKHLGATALLAIGHK